MRSPRLFAYGTLLDGTIQRRVFGRTVAPAPASVAGWRVMPTLVRARYPGVVRADRAETRGGILVLRSGELTKADAYEDAPRLYRRCRVTARSGRASVRCWMYVPTVQP
ncbi:MAG TPA: gamma-glutamylcyclotransferase family protein [Candidatus Didemnitutus sp.]|nr:gamma-glutamylcyclotransferase family protein [Candidatus Didemnitutus sp.]